MRMETLGEKLMIHLCIFCGNWCQLEEVGYSGARLCSCNATDKACGDNIVAGLGHDLNASENENDQHKMISTSLAPRRRVRAPTSLTGQSAKYRYYKNTPAYRRVPTRHSSGQSSRDRALVEIPHLAPRYIPAGCVLLLILKCYAAAAYFTSPYVHRPIYIHYSDLRTSCVSGDPKTTAREPYWPPLQGHG